MTTMIPSTQPSSSTRTTSFDLRSAPPSPRAMGTAAGVDGTLAAAGAQGRGPPGDQRCRRSTPRPRGPGASRPGFYQSDSTQQAARRPTHATDGEHPTSASCRESYCQRPRFQRFCMPPGNSTVRAVGARRGWYGFPTGGAIVSLCEHAPCAVMVSTRSQFGWLSGAPRTPPSLVVVPSARACSVRGVVSLGGCASR